MTTHTKTVTNGVNMEALIAAVTAIQENPGKAKSKFRIRNKWISGARSRTTAQDFYTLGSENTHMQHYEVEADEPTVLGGSDAAPNPAEHLLGALATCVTTSIVAHGAVNGIPIEEVESQVEGDLDLHGFLGLNPNAQVGFQNIRISFKVKTAPENIAKLRELAELSPIYKTISEATPVDLQIHHK